MEIDDECTQTSSFIWAKREEQKGSESMFLDLVVEFLIRDLNFRNNENNTYIFDWM